MRAALAEFNEQGFGSTDTNKIARRAGFAPQTFYRWFSDKTDVFLAAYRSWEEEELAAVASKRSSRSAARDIVAAIVAHHRAHLGFRRSLRLLAYENDAVRQARAQSRQRQLAQLRQWLGSALASDSEVLVALLQMERLSDAIAERELVDLGVSEEVAMSELRHLVLRLGSGPRRA